MDVLESLDIDHVEDDLRQLLLSRGRMSELAGVDYLLISSRARDYDPQQGGLVGELAEAGISVEELEQDCALDLRPLLPCWISKVVQGQQGPGFKRLVVFEPVNSTQNAPYEVWTVFQALRLFAGEKAGADADIQIALPVLSSASGEADFSVMLRMIFFAAASFASKGKWGRINIMTSNDSSALAQAEFQKHKASYLSPPREPERMKEVVASIARQFPAVKADRPDPSELGLTPRQFQAISNYTLASYTYFNRALRANDVSDPEYIYFQASLEALSSGLAKLENCSSEIQLNRFINSFDGVEDIYKVSNVVREAAFTSTTRRDNLPWGGEYKLELIGHIGKDIQSISENFNEQEVLFDSAMRHLISRIETAEYNERLIHIVTTRECAISK
ncbi:ADP-ribosyltransferase [Pseudomonas sp. LP_7_YM]|uniref:ADP-ribosyltransferase n=1 Tax=Pseudomonas sp. LP_7_YM TaxID=2485137 RepID=UPI00105FC3F1|nr:ADP-ribosyltransferase [Pseudomonas sp. LP_7_YM]TDV59688.1 ADP-ribosyltransferase exoenzyme [Pseudomonas sp. LP_7_YM]